MAQPAPAVQPVLLVASISDALADKPGGAALPPWRSWLPAGRNPSAPLPRPASALLAASSPQLQQPPQLDDFKLYPGRGRGGGPHAAAARHVQGLMQSAAAWGQHSHHQHMDPGHSMRQALASALNHHVVPLLTAIAVAQHHAVHHLTERMRFLRHRLGRSRSGDYPDGYGCSTPTSGPRPANRAAQRLFDTARALERSLDPMAAAEKFLAAAEADPRQAQWLSLAAKNFSDATYMPGTPADVGQYYNRKAIEVASRAMELAPDAAHSYIARCVSRGRLALLCDNRTKVQLAREACDDAERALALEPTNDYAHHLMGRWHYEMAGLNPVARTLVRLLFGTALMAGSYSEALVHFRSASQLAPRTLVHRVELGRTLARLGHREEAVSELRQALDLPVDDLNAHLQRLDADVQLCRLVPTYKPGGAGAKV